MNNVDTEATAAFMKASRLPGGSTGDVCSGGDF